MSDRFRTPIGARVDGGRFWTSGMALLVLLGAVVPGVAAGLTIRGHVYKGMGRDAEGKVPVTLHVVRGDEEVPGQSTITDKDGSFRFQNVRVESGLEYYVSTEYKGVVYTEGPIPTEGREDAAQDLVVFDVGRDVSKVTVTNQHVIVEKQEDGFQITEIMVIENAGETAYLGTGVNHAETAGVRIGLPASIRDFHPGMGGDEQTVRVQGRELSSARPIPPGTHPFTFVYKVPFSGRVDLSHRLYLPTTEFVVMLNDPKLHVESSSLELVGPREQGGKSYQVYKAAGLPVGAEVQMRLEGASVWSNPAIYPWLAAPFLIAAVLMIARRRGRRAATAGAELGAAVPAGGGDDVADEIHRVYLHLLAALDEGLERGEYSRESHALVRGNLKRRLEAILAEQPRARAR